MNTKKALIIAAAALVGYSLFKSQAMRPAYGARLTGATGAESTLPEQTLFSIYDIFGAANYYDVNPGSEQLDMLLEQNAGLY